MKRARQILELLCADLTTAINDVTARIMPAVLHRGLEELPDEILTDILVRDSDGNDTRYKELNLVNKRFHKIVSSTPSCWSLVDTDNLDISEMRKFPIIRKVSLPIDCYMSKETSIPTFIHLKDRIRSIKWLDSRSSDNTDLTIAFLILAFGDKSDLPSVKTLQITSSIPEDVFFPYKWTFSQLTSLECARFLPSGPFPCLRRCVLNLEMEYKNVGKYGWVTKSYSDYNAIYKFLEQTTSLESLSFPKNGNTPLGKDDGKPLFITLPKLKRLSLRCGPGKDNFLELLRCPQLETLEVELEPFMQENLLPALFDIYDDVHSRPRKWRSNLGTVTNLIITGGTNPMGIHLGEGQKSAFGKGMKISQWGLHYNFPHLKRLSIDGDIRIRDTLPREGDMNVPLALTSVYFRIPLKDHWGKLEEIFRFYITRKANLKYVEVTDWNRDPLRQSHTALKSLSALFPNIDIRVDEFKRVLKY